MTFILLVHHGDAVPADVDPQRPLSAAGRMGVERVAREAAVRGVRPAAIWHSGKLRARQTAELFRQACNPLAELTAVRGIQPDDPPAWIRDRLLTETSDVMIVGHLPHLPRLLRLLVGEPDSSQLQFPQHGVVGLERQDNRWVERWRLAPVV